jgi:hypothetical protein
MKRPCIISPPPPGPRLRAPECKLVGGLIRAGSPSRKARWCDPVADREERQLSDSATPLPNPPPQGGRGKITIALRQIVWLSAAALIFGAAPARAEVQKFLNPCAGQKLCASYALVLTPPDGWVLDAKATAENKVQIMVPKGQSFATAEPLIYVQFQRTF